MKKITLLAALFAGFAMNAQLLTEAFDDITTLEPAGYTFVNASDIPNLTWNQGAGAETFPAHEGGPDAYISVNYNSTSGSVINNFMITPVLNLKNGDVVTFWTRTITASGFPDRLEVRISPDGTDTPPSGPMDVGSYTELLLEINPTLTVGGYPEVWTEYNVTIAGLAAPVDTRVALRYFVTDGGPVGTNSNYIGVDTLSITSSLGIADTSFEGFNYFVSNNQLNLSANIPMEKVALYNMLGQQVVSQKLGNNSEVIELSGLQSGVYIATVSIDGASKSFKIVKN